MESLQKMTYLFFSLLGFFILINQAYAQNQSDTGVGVKTSYQNKIAVPPAVNPYGVNSSSAVFFGGNLQPEQVPRTDNVYLSRFSFGQMVSETVPYPNFINDSLNSALQQLYYEDATEEERDLAAFRYKALLYGSENIEGETHIRAQFENMSDYWGVDERKRALQAANTLKSVLRVAPWDRNLRHALLDIYYDTAVANIALAREKEVQVAQIMLELTPAPPGEFLISKEIELFEEAVPLYRNAAQGYLSLLNDPLGINVEDYESDPERFDETFGFYIFHAEVPGRSLMSDLFKDGNGNWVLPLDAGSGETQQVLVEGYKDVVLLFKLYQDYVRTAGELAKRYILRGNQATNDEKSDAEKARELIGSVLLSTYIETNVLLNTFPEILNQPDTTDSASGLLESIEGWRHEMSNISYLSSFIDGENNFLGFSDDFLVLVQSVIPGDPQAQYFDSYNFFKAYLTASSISNPLGNAFADWNQAKLDYVNYRDRNDQLALQFHDKTESYHSRLREIVGVNPGDAGYNSPWSNEGSEIWQQVINVGIARKKIEANQQEIANIQKQIELEIWRRGEERGINNAISQVYLNYGEKQASLTKEIAKINADQTFANNMASAAASISTSVGVPSGVSVSTSPGIWVYAINAFAQANWERSKGDKQADKERLAARERAQVQSLNDNLLDVNSRAQIKTWLLRMNVLSIESAEAALILQQEIGRMTALFNEKSDLERRKDESNELLADRYFADPSHRLTKDSSVLRTEFSFNNAQKWLFFLVRAAEYKWNKKFSHSYLNKTYNTHTLFKLRNSHELKDMYDAVDDWDSLISVGSRNDDSYKKFSFREDFLGYRANSQYHDPISGELVDPLTAFRSYLSQDALYLEPFSEGNPIPGSRVLKINFSTAYSPESGGLFLLSRWLEKIQFLRIKVRGGIVGGINSTIDGYLSYGGTSLIRNEEPGHIDPENPDRLVNETTEYSTRHWFYQGGKWKSKDAFGSHVNIQVSNDPDVPESVYQIDDFKEYSVATSNWTLYLEVESSGGLPKVDMNTIADIEFHLFYYWYARN